MLTDWAQLAQAFNLLVPIVLCTEELDVIPIMCAFMCIMLQSVCVRTNILLNAL